MKSVFAGSPYSESITETYVSKAERDDIIMKQIRNVTEKGLEYVDENGDDQYIDFEACYENFLNTLHFDLEDNPEQQREINKKWKRVGQRDFSGHPPYIEFFTDPVARFEFASIDEFHQLRYQVEKAGWRTIDLA